MQSQMRTMIVAVALGATARGQLFDPPQSFAALGPTVAYTAFLPVDIDVDGHLDIIAARNFAFALGTFFGDGDGNFFQGATVATPGSTTIYSRLPVGAADLTGDGLPDYVTTAANERLRVFVNIGGGQLAASPVYSGLLIDEWRSACLGDFDGDGLAEIVICGRSTGASSPGCSGIVGAGGGNVHVLRYDATNLTYVLLAAFSFPSENVFGTCAGDFDADGVDELALLTCTGAGNIPVNHIRHLRYPLSGAPAVGPTLPLLTAASSALVSWRSADVDLDGADDLVCLYEDFIAYDGSGTMYCAIGGAGGLSAPTSTPIPPLGVIVGGSFNNWFSTLGDVDGDGIEEAIMGPRVLRPGYPLSTGPLDVVAPWTTSVFGPTPVCAADFDEDGDDDVVFATMVDSGPPANSLVLQTVYFARSNGAYRPACGGATGPSLASGVSYLGNGQYHLTVKGAPANAPCAIGVTTQPGVGYFNGCTLWLSTAPTDLILPAAGLGVGTTDPAGTMSVPIPLPAVPALAFLPVYAQGVVLDGTGPWTFGGGSFSLTGARCIVLW